MHTVAYWQNSPASECKKKKMAVHGHGGNTAVTVTRGPGDAWAHCRYASAGCSDNRMMVGAHTRALCSFVHRRMLVVVP